MNRTEFLDSLKLHLQGMPLSEVNDILSDYEEHFEIGISKGKSEEEISRELGNTKDIANSYKTSYGNNYDETINQNNNTNDGNRKILMILLVIAFNVVIVLGPYVAILGVILSFFVAGISIAFSGIALMFGIPFNFIHYIANPSIITSLSFGVGLIALGILGIILTLYLAKWFYELTIKYIKWNVGIIDKGGF